MQMININNMASNKKKRSVKNAEGPVKIVGLHHNSCLGSEWYSEGWIKEKFVDIVFYCKPAADDNISTNNMDRPLLRANRSIYIYIYILFSQIFASYCKFVIYSF